MTETPLQAMCEELSTLAQHYEKIRAAIDGERFSDAAQLFEELEPRRQTLAMAHQAVDWSVAQDSPDMEQLLAKIQRVSKVIKTQDDELMTWLKANKGRLESAGAAPPEEAVPAIVRRVDAMVPADWDFDLDVVMMVGEGAAPVVRELLRRGQQRLLVYLPDGIEDEALPQETLVVRTLSEVMDEIQMMPGEAAERVITVKTPESSVSEERTTDIARTIEDCISQHRSNQATMNALGYLWAKNAVSNLAAIANWPSVASLIGAFENVPMVVISPGPSLSNNIHLLHQFKGKAVLVCVTHALSAMEKEGIVPDIVIGLEAQDVRYHIGNYPVEKLEALVLSASSHPQFFEYPARRFVTFTGNTHVEKWIYESIGEEAGLVGGGSVSCSGMRLGLQMGCNPIILVGQDLSFKDDGQLYVTTSCDGDAKAQFNDDDTVVLTGYSGTSKSVEMLQKSDGEYNRSKQLTLPGFYGGEVRTNSVFAFFHRWFENVAKDYEGKTELLNCTEGGAYIAGMQHMALNEAVEKHLHNEVNVGAVLQKAVDELDRGARIERMCTRALSISDAMNKSRNQAGKCLKLAKKARANNAALEQLQREERKLIEYLQPVLFLSLVQHGAIMEAVEQGSKATNVHDSLDASTKLYQVIVEAVNAIQGPLGRTMEKLNALT